MLLSIDRVLQLLSEGKSLEKISELASCEVSDVVNLITEARELINRHEKASGRRKVIIKKKKSGQEPELSATDMEFSREVLSGTELAAVPVNSSLTMYINGVTDENTGNAGIGIVIYDREDRQIGKVSDFVGKRSEGVAGYIALIRALKLADYFKVSELKVRTDSEQIVKQINGEYRITGSKLKPFMDEAHDFINRIKHFRIELVSRNQNDKADFLARKGSEKSR